MDHSLLALGAVIAVSLLSALIWHFVVKSYAWAVVGSSLATGLVTYWAYPLYRGAPASMLIIANALVLGAVASLAAGIPFKRWRGKEEKRA